MEKQIKHSPEAGFAEAQARILRWKEDGNVDNALELYSLSLDELPREIADLTNLQELNLSNNNLRNVEELSNLTNLISLDISDNKLVGGNDLRGLKKIENLNASGNELTSIEWVSPLSELTSFQVAGNKITSLRGIRGLKKLIEFDVCSNQLTTLEHLSDLDALEYLYINHNQLVSLKEIGRLPKVEEVHLQDNQVMIFEGLSKLPSLKWMNAARNRIISLDELEGMNKIEYLDLTANYMKLLGGKHMDGVIYRSMEALNTLVISDNNLHSLRPVAPLLEKGLRLVTSPTEDFKYGTLVVINCKMGDPPFEIAAQGTEAVLKYWKEVDESGAQINTAGRILLVGEGEAGKTSLQKKMLDSNVLIPPPNGKEPQTKAINISDPYEFAFDYKGEKKDFRASLWDFGGQVEKYMTHQFFFGTQSLYVLLVNARSQSPNLDYWIRIIALLGSRSDKEPTSVIIVQNEQVEDSNYELPLRQYKENFPNLKLLLEKVNLGRGEDGANDPRFTHLLNVIHREFTCLPRIGDKLLTSYTFVQVGLYILLNDGVKYILVEDFSIQCEKHGLSDPDQITIFLRYLHAIGEVIHYAELKRKDGTLKTLSRYVFLDPSWVTDAIYMVLEFPGNDERKGRLPRHLLQSAWSDYEPEEQRFLEELLLEDAFEICYPMQDNETLLIPSLLPKEAPDFKFTPVNGYGIRFRFNYPLIMPEGLISRLLVRLHDEIEEQKFYRYGAVFTDGKGIRARVERLKTGENSKNVIDIWVNQTGKDARYFLRRIRDEVAKIHEKSFPQITVDQKVPCTCETCSTQDVPHYYNFGTLARRERRNPRDTARCEVSDIKVRISEILEGVYPEQELDNHRDNHPSKTINNITNNTTNITNSGDGATIATNTGNGTNTIEQHQTKQTPVSFWRYMLEPQHLRGLGLAVILSFVAGLVITWLFGTTYGALVASIVFAVMCYLGLNREAGHLRFAKSVAFTGLSSVAAMNILPKIVGFLKLKYEGENGQVSFSGNLINDPPLWLSIAILSATVLIVLGILYINKDKKPATK